MMIEQLRTMLHDVENKQVDMATARSIGLSALEQDDAENADDIAAALGEIVESLETMFAAVDSEGA